MLLLIVASAMALRPPDGYTREETECAACNAIALELRDRAAIVFRPRVLARDMEKRMEVFDRACKNMVQYTRMTLDGKVRYVAATDETVSKEVRVNAKIAQFGDGSLVELQRELRSFCSTVLDEHDDEVDGVLRRLGVGDRLHTLPTEVCVHALGMCDASEVHIGTRADVPAADRPLPAAAKKEPHTSSESLQRSIREKREAQRASSKPPTDSGNPSGNALEGSYLGDLLQEAAKKARNVDEL
jgi:hypothetical protein